MDGVNIEKDQNLAPHPIVLKGILVAPSSNQMTVLQLHRISAPISTPNMTLVECMGFAPRRPRTCREMQYTQQCEKSNPRHGNGTPRFVMLSVNPSFFLGGCKNGSLSSPHDISIWFYSSILPSADRPGAARLQHPTGIPGRPQMVISKNYDRDDD